MTKVDIMGMMLVLLFLVAYRISRKASQDPNNKFSFGEAFTDATGKTSMGRLAVFVALVVSTWALIALVMTDELTEWFLSAYLGAFVINGVGSKLADKKNDTGS